MGLVNAFSILLIFATLISYIPQYRRMLRQRSSAGLSVTSTLLNVLVAQVQASTMYYLFLSVPEMRYGVPIANPPSFRDWLNLTQILVQWICSLVLFFLVIGLPALPSSLPDRAPTIYGYDLVGRKVAISFWILHILIFILSVFAATTRPKPGDPFSFFNIVRNIHTGIVNPIFTLLAAVVFFFQASVIWPARDDLGCLSKCTLGLQSVTLMLLAILWPFRLILPPNMWKLGAKPPLLMVWYPWVGWACINNGIMAFGQGALFFTVTRANKDSLADEGQPLLGS